MKYLPAVVRAEHVVAFKLRLTFDDGLSGIVDFSRWLELGPAFEPLKDQQFFRRFSLEGGTVAWPSGADIAPETLYDLAKNAA